MLASVKIMLTPSTSPVGVSIQEVIVELPPPPVDAMVTEPLDPVVIVTLLPALRYDVPSVSLVSDPETLVTASVSVLLLKVKLESPPKVFPSLNWT